MSVNQPLIKLTGVNQVFHLGNSEAPILHDISLSIPRNSFTIIYGPSGSGKTTLLNILAGLQAPSSGSVLIDDQDIYKLSGDEQAAFRAHAIGLVYQVNYWVKSLSVIENVALPLYAAGATMAAANKKALEVLSEIDMQQYAHYHPTVLSGGQQQRVSLARALVADPAIILADEPTGSLDTKNGQLVMELLGRIQKEQGRTIIMITHNLDYLPFSNSQVHIVDGQLVNDTPKAKEAKGVA